MILSAYMGCIGHPNLAYDWKDRVKLLSIMTADMLDVDDCVYEYLPD